MKATIAKIMEEELYVTEPVAETSAEFIDRICHLYLSEIEKSKAYAIRHFEESIIEEIQAETLEVFRAKIYGYYSLGHYRQMLLAKRCK